MLQDIAPSLFRHSAKGVVPSMAYVSRPWLTRSRSAWPGLVGSVLPFRDELIARFGVMGFAGAVVAQREAAKITDLYALTLRYAVAHAIQYVIDGQGDVFGGEIFLPCGYSADQFCFDHFGCTPCSIIGKTIILKFLPLFIRG